MAASDLRILYEVAVMGFETVRPKTKSIRDDRLAVFLEPSGVTEPELNVHIHDLLQDVRDVDSEFSRLFTDDKAHLKAASNPFPHSLRRYRAQLTRVLDESDFPPAQPSKSKRKKTVEESQTDTKKKKRRTR